MTKEELAAKLHGREYGKVITLEEEADAACNGLVVVYGASDDIMLFAGAINDSVDAYEGATAFVDNLGLQPSFEDLRDNGASESAYEEYFKRKGSGRKIKAIWCDRGFSWVYETDIPHATFEVLDDGEPYCLGIVFELSELGNGGAV